MGILPQSTLSRVLLMLVTLTTGIAMKPSPYRGLLFLLMTLFYLYTLFAPSADTQDPEMIYQMGLSASIQMGQAFDFMIVNEPQLVLRRKDADPKVHISKQSLFSRLLWATNLYINSRGANWNFEAPNLAHSTLPRPAFVVSRAKWAAFFLVALDVLNIYAKRNPILSGEVPFGTYGFGWQTWNVMVYWTTVYCYMQFAHCVLSSITVMLGVSSVNDWPSWHGHPSTAVSIRKFWGTTWHQALRRPLATMGKFIANDKLRYPKGSFVSSYIQLYVAFIMSGLIHASADWILMKNLSSFKGNLLFYSSQALVISFEDAVVGFANRLGMKANKFPKVLLYVWVIVCLGFTSPVWFQHMIKVGLNFAPPVSVVGYLVPTLSYS
ncbi:hypothetical protein CVT24_000827 [Panaeolus cyanescens]|uniref:Wax synthase domain-containing protein n=1 Tax=Panaeolus cyanescens TaxID=181874 RepID=A0A409YY49_9AGAR|nr:hypothetical protein CVT24_000827 [Panaeolus cyanescens]